MAADEAVWICPACEKIVEDFRPRCWYCGHSGDGVRRGPAPRLSRGPKRVRPTQGELLVLASALGVASSALVIPVVMIWILASGMGWRDARWCIPFVLVLVFGVLAAVAGAIQLLMNVRQVVGIRMAASGTMGACVGLWLAFGVDHRLALFAAPFVGAFVAVVLEGYRATWGAPTPGA